MNSLNVYVVGPSTSYASFLKEYQLTTKLSEADVVLFTGGEDVDPSLYGKKKHPTTHSNISRDLVEKELFEKIKPHQLVVGICRGSQFLCVMNGGLLVQNCNNHAMFGTHAIKSCVSDEEYEITSTHHQMQYPYELSSDQYTLLFVSKDNRCTKYEGEGINEDVIRKQGEAEIVLYHRQNSPRCLAIQGHPEMMDESSPVVVKLNELINDLLSRGHH